MESNTEPSLNYNKHYSTMPINIAFTHDMHVSITKNIFIALQLMLLYFTIPDQEAAEMSVCVDLVNGKNVNLCGFNFLLQNFYILMLQCLCMTQMILDAKGT